MSKFEYEFNSCFAQKTLEKIIKLYLYLIIDSKILAKVTLVFNIKYYIFYF